MNRLSPRFRHLLRLGLSALIVVVAVQMFRGRDLASAFSRINLLVLSAALTVNVIAAMVIPAIVTRGVLAAATTLSVLRLVRVNLIIRFYSLVLRRGAAMGIRWMKYKAFGSGWEAAGLVVVNGVFLVFGAATLAAIGLGVDLGRLGGAGKVLLLVMAGTALIAALVMVGLLSPRRNDVFTWILRAARRPEPDGTDDGGLFRTLAPGQIATLGLVTLVAQLFYVAGAWIVAVDLNLGGGVAAIVWMRSTISLIAVVPITIAGLGLREVGYVAFMALYDVPRGEALAFALVLLGIQVVIGLIGAALEIWDNYSSRRSHGDAVPKRTAERGPS